MSLVTGYSSDEDNGPISPTTDAFGLSSIPSAKKMRIDESILSAHNVDAAPDVLSEVCSTTPQLVLPISVHAKLTTGYRIH